MTQELPETADGLRNQMLTCGFGVDPVTDLLEVGIDPMQDETVTVFVDSLNPSQIEGMCAAVEETCGWPLSPIPTNVQGALNL